MPKAKPKVHNLRAKQILTFQHPTGGEALMMVDLEGLIYIRSEAGWMPFDMTEAPNDTTL